MNTLVKALAELADARDARNEAQAVKPVVFAPLALSAANDLLDNADELSERVRIVNYSQCVELLYVANGAYEYAIVVTYDNAEHTACIVHESDVVFSKERMRAAYQVEISAHENFNLSFDDVRKAFYPFALTLV